jgi:hypothetical protein
MKHLSLITSKENTKTLVLDDKLAAMHDDPLVDKMIFKEFQPTTEVAAEESHSATTEVSTT